VGTSAKSRSLSHPKNRSPERPKRTDRNGKRMVGTHVENNIVKVFKMIGAEQLKTTDSLLHEALAGLIISYGHKVPEALVEKLRDDGLYPHFQQMLAKSSAKLSPR
jgi:hypothetical protein